jgi:hypothetical protein
MVEKLVQSELIKRVERSSAAQIAASATAFRCPLCWRARLRHD